MLWFYQLANGLPAAERSPRFPSELVEDLRDPHASRHPARQDDGFERVAQDDEDEKQSYDSSSEMHRQVNPNPAMKILTLCSRRECGVPAAQRQRQRAEQLSSFDEDRGNHVDTLRTGEHGRAPAGAADGLQH